MWLYFAAALLGLFLLYFLFGWYRERQVVPNLQDKYVLITGCDTGFGNLLARKLDKRGMRVIATCLTQDGAVQLKHGSSERLQTVYLDVTFGESVEAMTEWVKQQVGSTGLWGLVNNAGISVPTAPNEWLTKQDFQQVLDVNLSGLIDVTLHLTPLVRRAKGRIVNISSIGGRVAFIGGPYCISKYGVEAFSDSLRREFNPFGVKVILIEPGFFKTAITDYETIQRSFKHAWDHSSPEIQESYGMSYFDEWQKLLKDLHVLFSSKLWKVTDCMEHSITSRHPRTRYSAGWDAKLLFIPLSYCPSMWQDLFFFHRKLKPPKQL